VNLNVYPEAAGGVVEGLYDLQDGRHFGHGFAMLT
jgi:hypothetical protein